MPWRSSSELERKCRCSKVTAQFYVDSMFHPVGSAGFRGHICCELAFHSRDPVCAVCIQAAQVEPREGINFAARVKESEHDCLMPIARDRFCDRLFAVMLGCDKAIE